MTTTTRPPTSHAMSTTIKNHAHLTVPEHDGPWRVLLWHPLKDMPLSMQITDAEADAFARDHAPVGWALSGATIQGRDQFNRRVICATFVRHEAAGNFFQGGPYDRA